MSRRYVSPALFMIGAALGISAAFELVGFYFGIAAIVCIVLGVFALPIGRPWPPHRSAE